MLGPLLEDKMSKKWMPLWREAYAISKSNVKKTEGFGALLDVQMSFCVAGARDRAPGQKGAKLEGFMPVSTTPATAIHYATLHYTTLHYKTLHYTTLHPTTLHHTTLHSTTRHNTPLHYTTLHYTTLHYTTLH